MHPVKASAQIEERTFASAVIIWLVNSAAILLASSLLDGVVCRQIHIAFIAGLALGLLTFLIEPVLIILTLPINVATFGLFTLVLNGIVLYLTSHLVSGFHFTGTIWEQFFWAMVTALIMLFFRMIVRSLLVRIRLIRTEK